MSVNSSSTVTGTKNIYLISDFHLVLFQIQRKWNALSSLCSSKYYSGFNPNWNFPCNMHTLTVCMISEFIFVFLMISYFRGELLRLSLVICLKTIFLFFFFLVFYFFNFKIFNSYMRSQTWTPPPTSLPITFKGLSFGFLILIYCRYIKK